MKYQTHKIVYKITLLVLVFILIASNIESTTKNHKPLKHKSDLESNSTLSKTMAFKNEILMNKKRNLKLGSNFYFRNFKRRFDIMCFDTSNFKFSYPQSSGYHHINTFSFNTWFSLYDISSHSYATFIFYPSNNYCSSNDSSAEYFRNFYVKAERINSNQNTLSLYYTNDLGNTIKYLLFEFLSSQRFMNLHMNFRINKFKNLMYVNAILNFNSKILILSNK